ncbi:glucosaminidase domain-containing protein [Paenibacillus luteus]|uniref:glucosaminidase domain-containing protein n=1 Tax=Paenibacillus luteus TaxID=2545753 RepID=UPI0011433ECA|nr:glucosaminidase domain-containing protein [Paenibacillus luteus]
MPADEAYVLSPTDVRNIRSYVQHKYAAMPQEARAEIVADAVKRIIHKQLPNFESNLKITVTETLIRTVVLDRQGPVRAEDILHACLSIDQKSANVYDSLHDWLEQQLHVRCEKPLMLRLMDKLPVKGELGAVTGEEAEGGLLAKLKSMLMAEGAEFGEEFANRLVGDVIVMPLSRWHKPFARSVQTKTFIYAVLCACLISASLLYGWSLSKPSLYKLQPTVVTEPVLPLPVITSGLPVELRYHEINQAKLIAFLQKRSSILAEQPYFDAIVGAAHTFDIHPALLFAITGQEQGFVPKTNKQHKEIANNPFNVFHSWQEFNTTIEQSAEIAARTVFNLSKERPSEMDPFTWINRKYAEDPKWSDGVRSIFASIIASIEAPTTGK